MSQNVCGVLKFLVCAILSVNVFKRNWKIKFLPKRLKHFAMGFTNTSPEGCLTPGNSDLKTMPLIKKKLVQIHLFFTLRVD